MAVDYSQGYSGAIADQYKDLRQALASEGEARNRQKAREIEDKGLFGSGIRQSDIADFGDIAIRGAEFGEKRMGRKMDRATASFERRKLADERRIASLKERAKGKGGKVYADLMGEIQGLEIGMGERRNSFEDFMGKYQEKGLWGTGFGGEDVGYRTEGESKYSQEMARKKLGAGPEGGSGDETDWSNLGDLGEGREGRFEPEGDRLDRYSSYPQGREFENTASFSEAEDMKNRLNFGGISESIAERERAKRAKQAEDMKKRLDFGGISERISNIPAGERARAQTKPFQSEWEEKHGRGTFEPEPKGMMNMEPLDFRNDRLPPGVTRKRLRELGYGA